MRPTKRRIDKYSKKIRGLVLPGQKGRFASAIGRQVEIEKIVNTIVGSNISRVYYIIFGKEVNKLMGKHKTEILDTELEILQDKWISRGLDAAVLASIKEGVGYVPRWHPFRLDVSFLDDNDRLS